MLSLFVYSFEFAMREPRFTADNNIYCFVKGKGNALNSFEILCNIFTNFPISSCCSLYKYSIFICQNNLQPINFWLTHEAQLCFIKSRLPLKVAPYTLPPQEKFFFCENIIKRPLRYTVLNFCESSKWFVSNTS